MKPYAIRLTTHDAERVEHPGTLSISLCSPGEISETISITALAEIEPAAAALAARYGKPCVVWVGPASRRERKPAGFDRECDRVGQRLYNEPTEGAA